MRPLYIEFGPVRALYDRVMRSWRASMEARARDAGSRVGEADRFRSGSWLERIVDRVRARRRSAAPPVTRARVRGAARSSARRSPRVRRCPEASACGCRRGTATLSWNPQEYRAFRAAVRPGATVLDVGANVGAYTLMFATWVGPGGRVFAFEPAPDARAGLATHLALNEFDGSRRRSSMPPLSPAVGARRSPFIHPAAPAALAIDRATRRDHRVATETIDHFCEAHALRAGRHQDRRRRRGARRAERRAARRSRSPASARLRRVSSGRLGRERDRARRHRAGAARSRDSSSSRSTRVRSLDDGRRVRAPAAGR